MDEAGFKKGHFGVKSRLFVSIKLSLFTRFELKKKQGNSLHCARRAYNNTKHHKYYRLFSKNITDCLVKKNRPIRVNR